MIYLHVFTVCSFESGSSTENQQPVAALSNSSYHVYDLGPYVFPKSVTDDVMCGWRQLSEEDDFDWTRRSGATPSAKTGPHEDGRLGKNGALLPEI